MHMHNRMHEILVAHADYTKGSSTHLCALSAARAAKHKDDLWLCLLSLHACSGKIDSTLCKGANDDLKLEWKEPCISRLYNRCPAFRLIYKDQILHMKCPCHWTGWRGAGPRLTAVSTPAEGVHIASVGSTADAIPAAAKPRPRCDQGILCRAQFRYQVLSAWTPEQDTLGNACGIIADLISHTRSGCTVALSYE